MTANQENILNKKFKVNKHFSITRGDYEGMPAPMLAWTWNDERMKQLAENINANLARYDSNDPDGMEDDFWATMENEAVKMGMEYYEDLEPSYCVSLESQWNRL